MKLALPSLAILGLVAALTASAGATAQESPPAADRPVTGEDADNARTNQRDRSEQATTPTQQSNASADVDLVANVRKAIVKDDSLSTKAHNVKIIANGGVVTLRGPVSNAQEKARIEELATDVHGVNRVENRLDIATDESH